MVDRLTCPAVLSKSRVLHNKDEREEKGKERKHERCQCYILVSISVVTSTLIRSAVEE